MSASSVCTPIGSVTELVVVGDALVEFALLQLPVLNDAVDRDADAAKLVNHAEKAVEVDRRIVIDRQAEVV
ncbi:MAG: hypothetical protein HND48_25115 [Chloroflexi bacterium]|nr:hypothetical protein [Chloroflexota bacterium]